MKASATTKGNPEREIYWGGSTKEDFFGEPFGGKGGKKVQSHQKTAAGKSPEEKG